MASMLFGEQRAKEIQLLIEYNPQPPFSCGHPDVADFSILTKVKTERKGIQKKRLAQIDQFIRSHKE
jgi:cyclohexyl-isocyanide hydratase